MSINSALAINIAITVALNAPLAILLFGVYRDVHRSRAKLRIILDALGLEVP